MSGKFIPLGLLLYVAVVAILVNTRPPFKSQELPPTGPGPVLDTTYGETLARNCQICHGSDLTGLSSTPPTANLTPAGPLASWSEEDFVTTMLTCIDPTGRHLSHYMLWLTIDGIGDPEISPRDKLHALWLYLKSLPPHPSS